MSHQHHLGDLQHAIMRVLWAMGEATVAQVHAELSESHPKALTTIATMLSKMERKGVVGHRIEGRQYVYAPTVSEEEVTRSMVSDLTRKLFSGDAAAMVGHLIREEEIDTDELQELQALIEAKRQEEERRDA